MSNKKHIPNIALASLPDPPPLGNIQFYDGYFPALTAGTYYIGLTHTITGVSNAPDPFTLPYQEFIVQAPQFFIDANIVQSIFPPAGNTNNYDKNLPYIVLTDPSLPWERSLQPGGTLPDTTNPTPWMALVIFAAEEIIFPVDGSSDNPVTTGTVDELLTKDENQEILKPDIPLDSVSGDMREATCQTITIQGEVFNAVMPAVNELPFLAHCRGINLTGEGEQLLSVILCNRFPLTDQTGTPYAPVRYYAHLISLEGFQEYLGPNATPIPNKPTGGLMDVQLVSLYNWTFVSLPDPAQGFESLIDGLIQSETSNGGLLQLPVPSGANLPADVQQRLAEGYVPLTFNAISGEQSFTWFRGPFCAAPAQPLPATGDPAVPLYQASSSDQLLIYIAAEGLFNSSYASAWNIGRQLALADANFVQYAIQFRQAATSHLNTLSQRMSLSHLNGETDYKKLLTRNCSRKRFAEMMAAGEGLHWTNSLTSARTMPAPPSRTVQRINKARKRTTIHPQYLLAQNGVAAAMADSMADIIGNIVNWLEKLTNFSPLPFSHLVPNPAMLPVESIRFFYVDPNWAEVLVAGAMSILQKTPQEAAIYTALLPYLTGAGSGSKSGLLISSQLIPSTPGLVISATKDNVAVNNVRDACLAPAIRLVLFDDIPDTINLAEPYQGLKFGLEENVILPRNVSTSAGPIGAPIPNPPAIVVNYRDTTGIIPDSVIDIVNLTQQLSAATGISISDGFGAGDFALQLVAPPELQAFTR